jgi:DHA2 family multidrug resistance protein-like MFS transporter
VNAGQDQAAPTTPTPLRAGRREWIGLAVIALPCVLYSMDLTVLNLAVPHLSADLKPSSSQLLWIVDIYGFLLAGSLLTMGTLGDRIGRRRLLLIGATAFGIASVAAALSTSAEMLIATRALLGVAGGTLAPSTLSLIRNMFLDPKQRTFAIGVWVTSFSVGAAIGPLFGGILLERFWWGSVFLLGVPVMVVLLVAGPLLLPEFRDPDAGRLDLRSAGLSLAGVLPVIFGLKQIAQDGLGWLPIVPIGVGLFFGAVFLRRQRRLADPLIDVRLFRIPAFSASLAINILNFFIGFGALLFIAQYLQLVLGLSPLEAGVWMLPWSGGFIVGALLTPVIVRRTRPSSVIAGGMVLAASGFGLMTQISGVSGLATLVTGSVVFSLGLAAVTLLTTDLIIGTAPPERAGAASGISETSAEFGGALGIAILGSIGTAVYRNEVADAIPAGVPPQAAEVARDTLGGALVAAAELPARLGSALLDAARDAFTVGFQVAATVSAVIAVGVFLLTVTIIRGAEPPARSGSEPDEDPHDVAGGGRQTLPGATVAEPGE